MAGNHNLSVGALPFNGERLLSNRLGGRHPKDTVLVSYIGKHPEYNSSHIMYATPGKQYDWRFLKGLDVCLLVKPGISGMDKVMLEIAKIIYPGRLFAWDIVRLVGAQAHAFPTLESLDFPRERWRYELDVTPWLKCENDDYWWHGQLEVPKIKLKEEVAAA